MMPRERQLKRKEQAQRAPGELYKHFRRRVKHTLRSLPGHIGAGNAFTVTGRARIGAERDIHIVGMEPRGEPVRYIHAEAEPFPKHMERINMEGS